MVDSRMTLWETFQGLQASREGMVAISVLENGLVLGRSFEGRLVIGQECDSRSGASSFRTRQLDFVRGSHVTVYEDELSERELSLDILRLQSSCEAHARALLNAVFSNYQGVGLAELVATFVDLFSSHSMPSPESILGLWGELCVIQNSEDPDFLIECWHQNWSGRTDFRSSFGAVEIKTSLTYGGDLFVQKDLVDSFQSLIILLVLAERSSEGQSVFDLRDELAGRVSTKALAKIDRIFLQLTLGDDSLDCSQKYRLRLRDEALVGIFTNDLPTVREWDAGVSRIRYLIEDAAQHGSLFGEEAISGITSVLLAP